MSAPVDDARVHDLVRVAHVHDLVRVAHDALDEDAAAPDWARASLARAPWVVVRRACVDDTLPVGIRGATRDLRYATRIARDVVRERLAPQSLVTRVPASTSVPAGGDRLARTARAFCHAASAAGLRPGITGSYGFELASGRATTHAASDLDAIVASADRATLRALARTCAAIEATTGVRIDVEVTLPDGGAALGDLVGGATEVLVKTTSGPRFVSWHGAPRA